MRFKATIRTLKMDLRGYRARVHNEMTRIVMESARVWLNATVTRLIPIWSGASVATFLHLARAANYGLQVGPNPGVKSRVGLGLAVSGPLTPITLDAKAGVYKFEYETALKHLIYNEFNDANASPDIGLFHRLINPGPYHFQEAGRAAFQAYAAGVRLPDPTASIVVTERQIK